MKTLNILGLIVFSGGALTLIGFGFYEFFKDSTIPPLVRWGIVALILGVIIILISLIKERLKEKKL
jgi:tetrahydromethanopterin S-methyltransferase subunit E